MGQPPLPPGIIHVLASNPVHDAPCPLHHHILLPRSLSHLKRSLLLLMLPLQVNFHPRRGFDSLGFGARGWFRDNPPKQPPAAANKAHYGAEGPQGFLYYYFVQRRRRSAALGVPRQLKGSDGLEVEALELDRCVWNYQKEGLARGAGGNPCRNYAEGPLLVHKQDSYARWFVAEALRRSNALEL